MKIFEIEKELQMLLDEVEEAGGELTPEQESQFDALELARADKIAGIAYHVKNLEAVSAACKEASKKLKEKADRVEKQKDSYKNFLGMLVPEKFQHKEISIKWRKNPPSVELLSPEDEIPDAYKKSKVEISVDKTEIKKDLQNGAELTFAKLVQGKRLVIE